MGRSSKQRWWKHRTKVSFQWSSWKHNGHILTGPHHHYYYLEAHQSKSQPHSMSVCVLPLLLLRHTQGIVLAYQMDTIQRPYPLERGEGHSAWAPKAPRPKSKSAKYIIYTHMYVYYALCSSVVLSVKRQLEGSLFLFGRIRDKLR